MPDCRDNCPITVHRDRHGSSVMVATMMATTYSAQGVTGHQVLMGTATDQVVALDKRWLDPRRPTKPTKDDKEEGLIPYTEVLPVFPQSWVTTRHQVAKLQGIVTSPASLESTVHSNLPLSENTLQAIWLCVDWARVGLLPYVFWYQSPSSIPIKTDKNK